MIREYMRSNVHGGELDFRWRGKEITRLEAFTDAVFAFAVTLLVVSLEVPRSFEELMRVMRGFIPFAICFALLVNIWGDHYRFFRRYGLQNGWVRFLNSVLLFFVLFYVYPLKFLVVTLFDNQGKLDAGVARELLVIYGLGAAALQVIFALLYIHALKLRGALELTALELMSTRQSLFHHVATGLIAVLSVLTALVLPLALMGIAGYVYFLLAPYYWITETIFDRQKRALGGH